MDAQVQVEANIDSVQIWIGEQAHISLNVSCQKGVSLELPHFRPLQKITNGIEFIESTNADTFALDNNMRKILSSVMAKPYSDSTSTPEPIIDHYEEREVERSRRVLDHIETYYTYEDNGNGCMIETPHERPVYKTEYYTVTEHVPVYKPQ